MVVVTIELWKKDGTKHHLGTAKISNIGGTQVHGEYEAIFTNTDSGRQWRECRLANFPRKRLLAWDLLYRALHGVIGDRNGPGQ